MPVSRRVALLGVLGVLVVLAYGESRAGADFHGWPNVPPDRVTHSILGGHRETCQLWIYPNGYIARCFWPAVKKKAGPGAA